MQVIGVGERRYFNGHSEVTIIFMAANGEQVDMPASMEQVSFVMQLMSSNMPVQPAPVRSRPESPTEASPLGDDEEEVDQPIRLGAFPPDADDGEPL